MVDPEASSSGAQAAAALAGVEKIEFREDKQVVGNESVSVSYEVADERVIVTRTGEGKGEVYTILEGDRVQRQLPMGITVVYQREGSTPPVAEGAADAPAP